MKIIIFIILTSVAFCSYAQTNKNVNNIKFIKESGYELQYPEFWRLDTSGMMGTDMVLFSPLENEADKFSENFTIIIQDLGNQNIGLQQYKEISDKQAKNLLNDAEIYQSEIISSVGKDCYKMIYAMTQGVFRLKITSICYIKNHKAYLATFTTELNKYDDFKKVGEEILSSFALR